MQKKLIIFDGNALLYRAFHALPPLNSKNGQQINALYGLISMLVNVIENLKPTHIIFCFDEKGPTFRNKLLDTYQAQRPEAPSDLIPQFQMARDFLKAANIPYYSKNGFEADDVIGTIASRYSTIPNSKLQITNGNLEFRIQNSELISEIVIITGDRDLLQVVNDERNVKLFMPIAGISNGKIFSEKETIERMGVTPYQIPDYKALVGDPSDNYFGISGIGPKTAIGLLEKYASLDEIYKHLKDLPDKLKEKLLSGKESAELSLKLATIDTNVPIEVDIENSDKWDLNSKNAQEFYSEFGFKTLPLRIRKLSEKRLEENQTSLF